jgi:ribosomal protein S18 acetylase RimI-like enzyme
VYRSEPLGEHHVLGAFRCGKAALDEWLTRHAVASDRMRNSKTHVWTAPDTKQVVAYFSFAPHLVIRGSLPRRLGHGAPENVPAILLAKLAIHVDLAGSGLGRHLLVDAFEVCLAAADLIGGRFLVVDAIDEAAACWYERRGFVRIAGMTRLFLKTSTIEASLRR